MIQEEIDVFNVPSNILNKKSNIYIIIFSILIFIFFIISMIIIIFYKFYEYETCLGIVNNDYNVVVYLKDFSRLNDYELYLEEEKIEFSIYSISDEYYIIDNDNYYEIILNVELKDVYKIKNNILNLKFKKYETTYLEKIKKGLGL